MKRLIIPVVIALLAGIGGGSGYAYMSASAAPAAKTTKSDTHDDSTAAEGDSASGGEDEGAVTDSAGRALHPADLPARADPLAHGALPMTPAESIRAVQAERAAGKAAGKSPSAHATSEKHEAPTAGKHGSAPASATGAGAAPPAAGAAGTPPRDAASAPASAATSSPAPALPEQRLAKIFGAMQARDAGRVLEQMTDSDIRTVLGMMSDKQAAAILATLSPQRAATITKGAVRGAGSNP